MSATQTQNTDTPSTDTTDSIDADTVQALEPGDIITANKLTRRQHQIYRENPDSSLLDVACTEHDYLVLNTPAEDDTRNVFAAKLIRLNNYSEYTTPDDVPSPYDTSDTDDDVEEEDTEAGVWNISAPTVPYTNEGTGVVISQIGTGGSIVTHILRDITITNNTEH